MTDFYLELDSLSMKIDGCWQINRSLLRVLGGPAKRGSNRVMPGAQGRRALTPVIDETTYDLELLVKGDKDHLGQTYSDSIIGKASNLAFLYGRFGVPSAVIEAVLHLPDGDEWTADVQVWNWHVAADMGASAMAGFDLVLVDGAWTTGS